MIPRPPASLFETFDPIFMPSPELAAWVKETFIAPGGYLENPVHAHLEQINLAFLWTTAENCKQGRRVIGQAQLLPPTGEKWSAARAAQQLVKWFDGMPEALITIDANAVQEMDDWQFCALLEHEMLHVAQKTDAFGDPIFDRETGKPLLAMKGHDVSEFVNVVQRYGATSPELSAMVEAVNRGPSIAATNIARACGTCLRIVK